MGPGPVPNIVICLVVARFALLSTVSSGFSSSIKVLEAVEVIRLALWILLEAENLDEALGGGNFELVTVFSLELTFVRLLNMLLIDETLFIDEILLIELMLDFVVSESLTESLAIWFIADWNLDRLRFLAGVLDFRLAANVSLGLSAAAVDLPL